MVSDGSTNKPLPRDESHSRDDHQGAPHRHSHAGHGHDHSHAPADFGFAFALGTGLNVAFIVVEATAGFWANSVALIADAGHNLSDVLGLLIAWGASVLMKRTPHVATTATCWVDR